MAPPNWFEKWIRVHGTDLKGYSLLVPGAGDFSAVSFDHPAEWESDTYLNAGDPTKIVIPYRLGGRYSVRATVRWERSDSREFQIPDRDESCFLAYFTKNGDTMEDHLPNTHMSAAPVVKANKTVMYVLWEGNLKRDDSIKLFILHEGTIVSAENVPIPVAANVWLTLRRLGPRV